MEWERELSWGPFRERRRSQAPTVSPTAIRPEPARRSAVGFKADGAELGAFSGADEEPRADGEPDGHQARTSKNECRWVQGRWSCRGEVLRRRTGCCGLFASRDGNRIGEQGRRDLRFEFKERLRG